MSDRAEWSERRSLRFRRTRFVCPYCGSEEPPLRTTKVSTAGWIFFALFFLTLIGILVCWVGFLIREEVTECADCGIRLGSR